jgi:GNAT superfamily N-acetyltransferase
MTIRPATSDDLPACVAMGLEFHATVADYARLIDVNAEALTTLGHWLLAHGVIFVGERDEEVVAMIGVAVVPHPMTGRLFGSEVFWYCTEAHRGCGVRLLRRAEAWAREQGAESMQVVAPDQRVAALYERLGYTLVERAFTRRLTGVESRHTQTEEQVSCP